jgi:ABC-type protease/lipase transport system fused ATPase/permease subunit
MISHRPNLVRPLDKVVLLKEGQLVGFGETDEIYKRLGRPVVVKSQNVG